MPDSQFDLPLLLDVATQAARTAGDLVYSRIHSELNIQMKPGGNYDLVTEMDIESERLIKEIIESRLPGSRFLAEESGGSHDLSELTWVVDPIDGTVNYAHGLPLFAVSIAAVAGGHPLVGVIYAPALGELFSATLGGGAFLGDRRMSVSSTTDISRSMLVTGFPYNVAENPFGCIDAFVMFLRLGVPIRRLGSASLDLAYVAAGRLDGFWEVKLGEWDVAAGALMVAESGGRIGSYAPEGTGSVMPIDRVLYTNGFVHEDMLRILRESAEQRSNA